MRKSTALRVLAPALAVALALWTSARAADHTDGPGNVNDPAADIGDVFAWMGTDARTLNLAMGIGGNPASPSTSFSDAVQYVFHVTSKASYTATTSQTTDVICEFTSTTPQHVRCWAGTSLFMGGDPSTSGGITSDDGRMRVATGNYNDPFFFNLPGFNATRLAVARAAPALAFDAAGCPQLDAATAGALATQLRTSPTGGTATDGFLRNNQRFLVVQIDKTLVNPGGPILGVWGSTHRM